VNQKVRYGMAVTMLSLAMLARFVNAGAAQPEDVGFAASAVWAGRGSCYQRLRRTVKYYAT